MSKTEPWADRWETLDGDTREGGQGETFRVRSKTDDTSAILKLLKHQKREQARRRMRQEVTNLQVLHEAGCKVPRVLEDNTLEFSDPGVRLYFVMEYIDGKTLTEVIREHSTLDLPTSVALVRDLSTTMKLAIENDVLHRDLKPDNIIVRSLEPSDAVIVDYGLSFNRADSPDVTRPSETLDNEFLSVPERRVPGGNRRDPRSDITGLCGILFYCLSGKKPVDLRDHDDNPPHRRMGISTRDFTRDVTEAQKLESLFDRGFSVSLEGRFQSVGRFLERISELDTPDAPTPIADLAELATRYQGELLREDTKTRFARFQKSAQGVLNRINSTWANEAKALAGYGRLATAVPKNFPHPPGSDLHQTMLFVLWAVNRDDFPVALAYEVRLHDSECTLYRALVRVSRPTTLSLQRTLRDWESALHFDGLGEGPDPEVVANEVKRSIASALHAIQELILGNP